jgi:hypothetical protein
LRYGIDELRNDEDDADEDVSMDDQAEDEDDDNWQDEVSPLFFYCLSGRVTDRKPGFC